MWAEKTAKMVTLLIDPTYPLINVDHQINLIKTLQGATGTIHAGLPAVQRIAYGGGSEYSPNFLTDVGAAQYAGYVDFLDNHVHNDMVWYANISGPSPSVGDRDIEELVEHLMHTIHLFGIMGAVPGSETAVNWLATNNVNWQTTELHLAMKEAIDGGFFDPSDYASDWATVDEAAEVAYKEYMYLINWSMWDMSTFWDGGSLSPEWSDSVKTPSGMLTNNPKGYALFKSYFEPVLSKPDFAVLRDIFRDNDLGPSYYTPASNGASRIKQINWFQNNVGAGTGTYVYDRSGSYTNSIDEDDNNHGCHCAGTVAGNTQGWARDANIYNISPYSTNPNSLSSSLMWDYIRAWHNSKPINVATGRRNPTITNNSYGSTIKAGATAAQDGYDTGIPTRVNYRGTDFNPGRELTQAELQARGFYCPLASRVMSIPYYFTSRQADMQDAIDDGIIIVASAGNASWKTVNSSDQDYNNDFLMSYNGTPFTWWLNRGTGSGAGYAPVINVGATSNDTQEDKAPFSNVGSQVDIFAAGEAIQSSLHTGGVTDARNSSYDLGKYQGTSMSGPQVAGVLAILAESWPNMDQAQAETWLSTYASVDQMQDTEADDAMDTNSLQGAPNKYLRWINQRKTEGQSYPLKTLSYRPISGMLFPRTKIQQTKYMDPQSSQGSFAPDFTITVNNNGSAGYVMSGTDRNGTVSGGSDNPTLAFNAGDKVRFNLSASGHPFYIKTVQGTGTGNQASGVDGQGMQEGPVDWTVGSAGTYYYNCQFHGSMSNTITVS
jgi:plastocyanin